MGLDQHAELADDLHVSAKRQVGLDPVLQDARPDLLKPRDLRPREPLVADIRKR
jgi:hypothetical protein